MKKIIALALVCVMALALVACSGDNSAVTTNAPESTVAPETTLAPETTAVPEVKVMSYAEYAAADRDSAGVI